MEFDEVYQRSFCGSEDTQYIKEILNEIDLRRLSTHSNSKASEFDSESLVKEGNVLSCGMFVYNNNTFLRIIRRSVFVALSGNIPLYHDLPTFILSVQVMAHLLSYVRKCDRRVGRMFMPKEMSPLSKIWDSDEEV